MSAEGYNATQPEHTMATSRTQQIHLDVDGNDRGDGSAAHPVATPRRAQLLARRATGPVHVVVHAGVYELEETLVFTPADNGQRWSAATGCKPVFSGGRRLGGWSVSTQAGQTAWTIDLPEVRDKSWNFTQLWVDGQRRSRPRLPRTGFYRFSGVDGLPDTGFSWLKGPDRAEYPEGTISRFRNLDDVTIVAYQLWFDTHLRVRELDETRRLVRFHGPSLGSLRDEGGQFARFVLINVAEALSQPGEWYLDRPSGRLTYLPHAGERPETVSVVAPRLEQLIRFQGTRTGLVSEVVLENIGLEHNEWSRLPTNCGTIQAAFDVPGAVLFDQAERCVLYGCELAHCAGYGVEMLAGSSGNVIAACTIRDLGAGAVKIGHEELQVHDGAVGRAFRAERLRPMAATVADCHLHDGGHVYPSAIGVWIGNAGGNRIQHNHIHHFSYTGISFGWTWGYQQTRTWDNRIDWNYIHHINHERLLSDNGGIYSLGVQPGSTVIGNHLHDIACYHYGGWGLYPDEGSSGITYRDNCVHDVQYCGFSVHYGRFLTVKNNIFATMDKAMLNPGRADLSCGIIFERNLTWFDRDNLKSDADWHPELCATKRNLVWNAGSGGVHWHQGSLANEQAVGRWVDSIEADPLFVDPRSGDFALRADSPALQLGFRPFDWRKAGVRTRRRLSSTWRGYRLPASPVKGVAVARIEHGELVVSDGQVELPMKVILSNPSNRRVKGVWRIRMGDRSIRPIVEPSPQIVADLAAGGEVVRELRVRIPAGQGRQWLQVVGDERTCFSAAIPLVIPVEVRMARTVAGLKPAVGLDIGIVHAGASILSGSAAVVGSALVVDLTVRDAAMRLDRVNPWLGASVELFLAPEPAIGVSTRPTQLILIPADAHGPAEVRRAGGDSPPSSDWSIEAVEGGWHARLRIDLASVDIANDAKRFRFDLICNAASPVAGQNFLKLARWGSLGNFSNTLGLARIILEG